MKHLTQHLGNRTERLLTLGLAAFLGLVGLSLTACNTTEGVGQDIEAAGEGIQDAAD